MSTSLSGDLKTLFGGLAGCGAVSDSWTSEMDKSRQRTIESKHQDYIKTNSKHAETKAVVLVFAGTHPHLLQAAFCGRKFTGLQADLLDCAVSWKLVSAMKL